MSLNDLSRSRGQFRSSSCFFGLQLNGDGSWVDSILWNEEISFAFNICDYCECMEDRWLNKSFGNFPMLRFSVQDLTRHLNLNTTLCINIQQCFNRSMLLWVSFLCLFHSDPAWHATSPALHPAADPPWLHDSSPGGCTESALCVREECVFSDFFWKAEAEKQRDGP